MYLATHLNSIYFTAAIILATKGYRHNMVARNNAQLNQCCLMTDKYWFAVSFLQPVQVRKTLDADPRYRSLADRRGLLPQRWPRRKGYQ